MVRHHPPMDMIAETGELRLTSAEYSSMLAKTLRFAGPLAVASDLRLMGCPVDVRDGEIVPVIGYNIEKEMSARDGAVTIRWRPSGQGR